MGMDWSTLTISAPLLGVLLLGSVAYILLAGERPYANIPIVTTWDHGWRRLLPAKFAWIVDCKGMLTKGAKECPSCFQVLTSSGYKIIVPNCFVNDLKSHPDLSFNEGLARDFPVDLPGFEGFKHGLLDGTFIQHVVRVKLTQSLGLVTNDLVDEADACMQEYFGEDGEWQNRVKEDILNLIARLSSRVFLGRVLCRDPAWLEISKNYTVDSFMAANLMRLVPAPVRPLICWLIPTCTRLRREVHDARRLILPEVDRRRRRAEAALRAGQKPPKTADTIGWMVEVAQSQGREVDYVAAQLSLTIAAIHTTSETLTKCILQVCDQPELVQPLRDEMIEVLKDDGWSKAALTRMKLLDSFLKEVQRTHTLTHTSMNRLVKKDITLSDGTILPMGSRILVPDDRGHDPLTFDHPEKFDLGRFVELRQQPGGESRYQFVTTTSEHLGFGHGQHACPGRFLAGHELKIAMCFFLLRYDLSFVGSDGRPKDMAFETASMTDPKLKFQIRRRREEIDLVSPTTNGNKFLTPHFA